MLTSVVVAQGDVNTSAVDVFNDPRWSHRLLLVLGWISSVFVFNGAKPDRFNIQHKTDKATISSYSH